MRKGILLMIVAQMVMIVLAGCSISTTPRGGNQGVSEDASGEISRLSAGDMVEVRTIFGEELRVSVSEVGDDYIEGTVMNVGGPGDDPFPRKFALSEIATIDNKPIDAVTERDAFEPKLPEEDPPGAETSRENQEVAASMDDNPVEGTVMPEEEIAGPYGQFLSKFKVGDVVDIVTHSDDSFQLKITGLGSDSIRGTREGSVVSWEDSFPDTYFLSDIRSINGVFVPVDLSRFKVGDKVELVTAGDEQLRMEIVRIGADHITGRFLNSESVSGGSGQTRDFSRDDIRTMKKYVPVSHAIATTLEYVGKGILIVVGVTAMFAVALMFALAGVPPPFYP